MLKKLMVVMAVALLLCGVCAVGASAAEPTTPPPYMLDGLPSPPVVTDADDLDAWWGQFKPYVRGVGGDTYDVYRLVSTYKGLTYNPKADRLGALYVLDTDWGKLMSSGVNFRQSGNDYVIDFNVSEPVKTLGVLYDMTTGKEVDYTITPSTNAVVLGSAPSGSFVVDSEVYETIKASGVVDMTLVKKKTVTLGKATTMALGDLMKDFGANLAVLLPVGLIVLASLLVVYFIPRLIHLFL